MERAYAPSRGDIVWLSFDPQLGHEQMGTRPAVTLSPLQYNKKVGLGIFCPITSLVKGYPFEVAIPDGLPIVGVVLSDQVKSLDWQARRAQFVCSLPDSVMAEILGRLVTLLG
ncbi:MAG: endoribonuclease MazF [Bacillota bacterium]